MHHLATVVINYNFKFDSNSIFLHTDSRGTGQSSKSNAFDSEYESPLTFPSFPERVFNCLSSVAFALVQAAFITGWLKVRRQTWASKALPAHAPNIVHDGCK